MNETASPAVPTAFISYAWTTPTHEAWVLALAIRLMEDGVEIKLDKWDLRPGQSTHEFMESMVLEPAITKVLMICDRRYVEKADSREGGVGTESQIISPNLYGRGQQSKFAALVRDVDESQRPLVPVFYSGRMYFDFTRSENEESSYDELLRWLVDKPRYVKPKRGVVPTSILEVAPVASGAASRFKRAEDAVRRSLSTAPALIQDYGDNLSDELRALAPKKEKFAEIDEAVLDSFESLRPYLRQFYELVAVVARYPAETDTFEPILRILEKLGKLMYRGADTRIWSEADFDSYRMAAYEAVLAITGALLREERFELAERLIARAYLVSPNDRGVGRSTDDFTVFRQHHSSMEYRKSRLGLNRLSLEADMIKEAHQSGVPSFEEMQQADLVLFLRSMMVLEGRRRSSNWFPHTLVYAGNRFSPFEIFARAESRQYFDRIAPLLGVRDAASFKETVLQIEQQVSKWLSWQGLPLKFLTNIENIAVIS